MFLTTREKRRMILAIVLVVIIAIGIIWYFNMGALTPNVADNTKTTTQKETATQKESAAKAGITSYTQYNKAENTCVYNYEGGKCYVPLSFCITDPAVKTPQELDRKKYCSETPEIKAKALESPKGSACPFTATEGDLIDLYSIVRDPDEADPTHPYGPLGRLDVSFSEPFKGSKGLWKTEKGDAGLYKFDISVTDGQYTDTKPYCIEVLIGNRPPVLSNLNDMSVVAGDTVTLEPKCVDPDNDPITLSYYGDITGREWMTTNTKKTENKDIGNHIITVKCADIRGLPTYKSIKITVLAAPIGPELGFRFVDEPKDVTIKEGETVTLNPSAQSDAGKPIKFEYSGWMTSNTKTASYTDAGVHEVTVTATDGVFTLSRTILVTVINVNRPPEIVGTKQVE